MKFSIITPCLNSEKYIKETMLSVLNQTAVINEIVKLEYILIDGGSKDDTLKIINSFTPKKNVSIKVISEIDNGMYEALSKGLKASTGNVQAYINAGDLYNLNAFQIVYELFSANSGMDWLVGGKYIYNEKSFIIKNSIPYKYRNILIQAGIYGRYLPFIQQESVFWKSKLNNYIDHKKLTSLKLSGDYFLWVTFSNYTKLDIVQTHLGGFKIHQGQLSSTINNLGMNYKKEMETFTKKINIKIIFYIMLDLIPWAILKYSNEIFGYLGGHHIFKKSLSSDNNYNELYCWACDTGTNRGEGQLLYKFINENYNHYKSIILKNTFETIVVKNNLFDYGKYTKTTLKLNFFRCYISPYIGILYLWYKFVLGKPVCYINFLPLWNFPIFLLLPPGTILGPITGSVYDGKIFNIQSFLRKYLIPILYFIGSKIISFRKQKIIFSTELLKPYIDEKKKLKYKFNYIFQNIKINNYNQVKDIDLLIYNRNYFNKSNSFFKRIITSFEKDKFNFYYFGDEIDTPCERYLKILDNNTVQKYLNRTKFTLISNENFHSFYCLEAVKNNVNLFYNQKQHTNIDWIQNSGKILALNYDAEIETINKIKEAINNFEQYDFPYVVK
jgi:glycosyltransferase involved in cell wall biosynthesis